MPSAPYTLEQAETDIADLRGLVDRMGEVHALDSSGGVVPNAQPNQAQLYPANGGPAYVGASGLQMNMSGAQACSFPNNSNLNNTTLNTLGTWTIPAGDASVGAVYEMEIWGNGAWSNVNTAAGALTLTVVAGGNSMSTVTLGGAYMLASSAFRFRVAGRIMCETTGVGGTWTSLIFGECSVNGTSLLSSGASSSNATSGFVSCDGTGTTVIDTTGSIVLGVSSLWGSGTAGGNIISRVSLPKRIC